MNVWKTLLKRSDFYSKRFIRYSKKEMKCIPKSCSEFIICSFRWMEFCI